MKKWKANPVFTASVPNGKESGDIKKGISLLAFAGLILIILPFNNDDSYIWTERGCNATYTVLDPVTVYFRTVSGVYYELWVSRPEYGEKLAMSGTGTNSINSLTIILGEHPGEVSFILKMPCSEEYKGMYPVVSQYNGIIPVEMMCELGRCTIYLQPQPPPEEHQPQPPPEEHQPQPPPEEHQPQPPPEEHQPQPPPEEHQPQPPPEEPRRIPLEYLIPMIIGPLFIFIYLSVKDKTKLKLLTQNALLIPGARDRKNRTNLIPNMIKNYDIVALQEVFSTGSQEVLVGDEIADLKLIYIDSEKWKKGEGGPAIPKNGRYVTLVDGEEITVIDGRPPYDKNGNKEEARMAVGKISHKETSAKWYYAIGPMQGYSLGLFSSDWAQDSGLVTLSKYPIVKASAMVYNNCAGWDSFSDKGALYICINIGMGYLHVFNTHLQSKEKHWETRKKQLDELIRFINNCVKDKEKDYPVILMGDLNVDGILPKKDEEDQYKPMMKILEDFEDMWLYSEDVNEDPEKLRSREFYTWVGRKEMIDNSLYGPNQNILCEEKKGIERLDYILVRQGSEYKLTKESIRINRVPSRPPKKGDEKGYFVEDYSWFELKDAKKTWLKEYKAKEYYDEVRIEDRYIVTIPYYTVSDHLGVEMEFTLEPGDEEEYS